MTKILYTKEHEWLKIEGETAIIGITLHAQDQLGDLVFVDLPEIGREIERGASVVVVESVKAASDVYAPIAGKVLAINEDLKKQPELVNSDAEGAGWLWKMHIADETQLADLMDKEAYHKFIGQ